MISIHEAESLCKQDVKMLKHFQIVPIQRALMKWDALAIRYIDNPTDRMIQTAIEIDGRNIRFIPMPTDEQCALAIGHDKRALKYISHRTIAIQIAMVQKDYMFYFGLPKPSKKVLLAAVKANVQTFIYIIETNQSDLLTNEILIKIAKMGNWYAHHILRQIEIGNITNSCEELNLTLVKSNSDTLEMLPNPSEEVQLQSVIRDGESIKYIKNPSEELQLIAIKSSPYWIFNIKNPTLKVQMEAVKKDCNVIKHIENPHYETQMFIAREAPMMSGAINNPVKEVREVVYQKLGIRK